MSNGGILAGSALSQEEPAPVEDGWVGSLWAEQEKQRAAAPSLEELFGMHSNSLSELGLMKPGAVPSTFFTKEPAAADPSEAAPQEVTNGGLLEQRGHAQGQGGNVKQEGVQAGPMHTGLSFQPQSTAIQPCAPSLLKQTSFSDKELQETMESAGQLQAQILALLRGTQPPAELGIQHTGGLSGTQGLVAQLPGGDSPNGQAHVEPLVPVRPKSIESKAASNLTQQPDGESDTMHEDHGASDSSQPCTSKDQDMMSDSHLNPQATHQDDGASAMAGYSAMMMPSLGDVAKLEPATTPEGTQSIDGGSPTGRRQQPKNPKNAEKSRRHRKRKKEQEAFLLNAVTRLETENRTLTRQLAAVSLQKAQLERTLATSTDTNVMQAENFRLKAEVAVLRKAMGELLQLRTAAPQATGFFRDLQMGPQGL